MSELYLCNCIFCLENNPDGKLVVKSIYYRHRRKDQVLLKKELSDNEKEEENDAMQVDEERLNKKVIEGLRLLHLKSVYNFTEAAYNDIIKLFANENLSLYKIKKILEEFTRL